MQNLKIRVNSKAESKEAQELFFELGYEWRTCGKNINNTIKIEDHDLCTERGFICITEFFDENQAKEITLPELRNMVVLERNDVNDATHESSIHKYFKACDDWYYFDLGCTDKWQKSSGAKPEYYEKLKTIEKKMKEYLMPSRNYEYILTDAREALEPHAEDWIAIPEGMNFAYKDDMYTHFTKMEMGYRDAEIIWQRATHPEELPFIDDEPKYTDDEVKYMDENGQGRLQSINDQYAEIEQVRQAIKVKSGSDSNHALDAMSFGLMGLSADANHAQQQTIEATLAERQSTYGNFEDVAFVTENIMSILAKVRPDGLQDLPNAHRMALYMIASKMARIVNGDFNHLDSWHDIGGYSKLIEKLIKGD